MFYFFDVGREQNVTCRKCLVNNRVFIPRVIIATAIPMTPGGAWWPTTPWGFARGQPSICCDPQSALLTGSLVEPTGAFHSDCLPSPQHLKVTGYLQEACLFPRSPSEAQSFTSLAVFLPQMLASLGLASLSCSVAGDTRSLHLLSMLLCVCAMGNTASILFSLSVKPRTVLLAQPFTHSFIPQVPGTWYMPGITLEGWIRQGVLVSGSQWLMGINQYKGKPRENWDFLSSPTL